MLLEFYFGFLIMLEPAWTNMLLLCIWSKIMFIWFDGFPVGYWLTHKCNGNDPLIVVEVPMYLENQCEVWVNTHLLSQWILFSKFNFLEG